MYTYRSSFIVSTQPQTSSHCLKGGSALIWFHLESLMHPVQSQVPSSVSQQWPWDLRCNQNSGGMYNEICKGTLNTGKSLNSLIININGKLSNFKVPLSVRGNLVAEWLTGFSGEPQARAVSLAYQSFTSKCTTLHFCRWCTQTCTHNVHKHAVSIYVATSYTYMLAGNLSVAKSGNILFCQKEDHCHQKARGNKIFWLT